MTNKHAKSQVIKRGGLAMRAQNYCPNCGAVCFVSNSYQISKVTRETWLRCSDERCGWSGVQTSEIIRTVTLPHPANVQNDNLPPPLEKEKLLSPRQTNETTELF